MAIALSKTEAEIRELPLVELAWEVLKVKKEPYYFRDLMDEIRQLRNMSEEEVMDVIARLYTEINIDGRFVCIGQNVWGLKRWYPVDKVAEKSVGGKRFVRRSGDAFSDDDEDLDLEDEFEEDDLVVEDETEDVVPFFSGDDEDDSDDEDEDDAFEADEEEEVAFEEEEADAEFSEDEDEELFDEDEDNDDNEDDKESV